MKRSLMAAGAWAAWLAAAGCIHIAGVQVITSEEALQNQVAGVMEDLGDEVMLYESVRGVDEDGKVKTPPKMTESKLRVIAATQSRQFNADDIQSFLREGCARENNRGLLDYYETEKCKKNPEYAKFVKAIIREENRDRMIIMRRVIEVGEGLSEKDLPRVQKIFARRNRDAAEPGVWVQNDDGSWMRKPPRKKGG